MCSPTPSSGIVGILRGGMASDCVRVVILMYVYVATPTQVGAWSMAMGLRRRIEYYYYKMPSLSDNLQIAMKTATSIHLSWTSAGAEAVRHYLVEWEAVLVKVTRVVFELMVALQPMI